MSGHLTGSGESSRPHPAIPWAWPGGLALLGALVPLALWAWHDVPTIGGADPGMWEAAALVVAAGEPSPVAPVFPRIIAALTGLTGLGWDAAGMAVAWACFAALGPATWMLARRLGASPALAGLGAAAVLLEPWLGLGALQCQPDSLSALVFVAAMLLGLAWVRDPRWRRLLPLLLVIGLLPQVREHAPLMAAGLIGLLALAPGSWTARVGRVALALLAVLVTPVLLGEPPALPWELHWVQLRWGEVVQHFFETGSPAFLEGTPRAFGESFAEAYAGGQRLRIAWLHASLSFHSGWAPWLWLLPGLAGWLLLGRRRWLLLAGFLPLLAVPGGAQQPRHVAVLVPLALACWAASLTRLRRPERSVLAGASVALVLVCCLNLPRAAQDHAQRCALRLRIIELADELCARLPADAVAAGGNPRPLVYCDRPRVELVAAEPLPVTLFWIGPLPEQRREDWPRLQADGWRPLPLESEQYPVYTRPER